MQLLHVQLHMEHVKKLAALLVRRCLLSGVKHKLVTRPVWLLSTATLCQAAGAEGPSAQMRTVRSREADAMNWLSGEHLTQVTCRTMHLASKQLWHACKASVEVNLHWKLCSNNQAACLTVNFMRSHSARVELFVAQGAHARLHASIPDQCALSAQLHNSC